MGNINLDLFGPGLQVRLRNVWFTRDASAAEDQTLLACGLQRSLFGLGPQTTWHEEDERLTRSLGSLKLPKRGYRFGRNRGVKGVLRSLKTEIDGVAVRRAGLMLAAFQRQVKRCSERFYSCCLESGCHCLKNECVGRFRAKNVAVAAALCA